MAIIRKRKRKSKLIPIMKKEFKQAKRSITQIIMLVIFPLILVFVFALAFENVFSVEDIATVVYVDEYYEKANPLLQAELDDFIDELDDSKYFEVTEKKGDYKDAKKAIKEAKYKCALYIPIISNETNNKIDVIIDNSDSSVANSISLGFQELSGETEIGELVIEFETKEMYGDLTYMDYLIPGIIALAIAFLGANALSTNIIEERLNKTLERVLSSDVRPWELLIGKLLSYFCIAFLGAIMSMILGFYIFGAVFTGNIWLFLLIMAVQTLTFCLYALMSSNVGNTPLECHFATDMALMPMLILGGIFMSLEAMSPELRPIANILPLTLAAEALKCVAIKNADFFTVLPYILGLFGYAFLFLCIGLLLFNKKRKNN